MANVDYSLYPSGGHKWDSDKEPYTRRGDNSKSTEIVDKYVDHNTFNWLVCPDVVIEANRKSFSVITYSTVANVDLAKVTSIDRLSSTILVVMTRDEIPMVMGFKDATNLERVEERLWRVMNGGNDNGCGGTGGNEGGDFNNDYNEDFN